MTAWSRGAAKRVVEAVLRFAVEIGPARGLQGRALVLAYHGVTPRGEREAGERSLHIGQEAFAAQLDEIARRADVVPLDEVMHPPGRGRPRVVITFDDAYVGAVEAGVTELVKRGLPATIFACSSRFGSGPFWWDQLAEAGGGTIPAGLRDRYLTELCGVQAAIQSDPGFGRAADVQLPPHLAPATVAQVRTAMDQPGISVASHTATHPNLTRLFPGELATELGPSLTALRAACGSAIPWLAYPYGLESPAVQSAAAAAGFVGAVKIGGPRRRSWEAAPHAVSRLNVASGLSLNGFVLRVAGWFGE